MDFLNSILNNIDEALIITDADGKILLLNEAASIHGKSLLLGRPLQEGEYLANVASPKRKKIVGEMIREIHRKKRPGKSFAEYTNLLGSTVYLELNYVPILNDTRELTHIYLFVRDITSQKVFEKKLLTQTRNMSNLIEKANAIIIGVDTLGYVTDWNDHCSKITGFEKDEVYARKLVEILVIEDGALNNESMSNYEITVRTKDGKSITLLLSGTPRTTSTGEVVGFMFVGQDVTELSGYRKALERKVEERTRELQRALKKEQEVVELKSRFVSIASHEFRTPLSTIQYSTNFIRLHPDIIGRKDLQNKLDTIEKQVAHMTSLLDDVLTYGKSESGKINLVLSGIVLADFFKKIIEEVGHNTNNTHTIVSDFHNIPEELTSDEKLLRNITINLLTNAIKFSPGKKYVDLIVRKLSGDLIITVRDEGIGIPADEMDKIFDPFLRGKATSAIQGTGLGLSIVKKAVELLQGTIQTDSQVGRGTTFTVIIPENAGPPAGRH